MAIAPTMVETLFNVSIGVEMSSEPGRFVGPLSDGSSHDRPLEKRAPGRTRTCDPGLEGRGYEATGGSGTLLLLVFLGFSHNRGNPDPPPAATDCPWIVHDVGASVMGIARRC